MTAAMKRLGVTLATHVLAVGLGAGVYAAQDQNTRGPGRPFMEQRGGPGGPGPMAGRGGPMGPMGLLGPLPPRIAEQLGLSDAQKDQIRNIMESHRVEVRALMDRANAAREALEAAITSTTFDETTIRVRSAESAAIEADMAVMRARIRAEVVQILTPAQQTQLGQLQSQMQQRQRQGGGRPQP